MTNSSNSQDASQHAIQSLQDEESFLLQQLLNARTAVEVHKQETSMRTLTKNRLDKELQVVEQALIDYFVSNGLKQFHACHLNVTISETESIDAPDVDAIPAEFIREKTTKEPNKILIKELRPKGNWYSVKQGHKITVKGE